VRGAIALVLLVAACGGATVRPEGSALDDWNAWRAERHEELAGPDGWLALVGLFWLEPGEATIGSDPSSTFVLPGGPASIGRVVTADDVRLVTDDGEHVLAVGGDPIAIGSLRLLVIERAGRRALRVRDTESAARASLGEIPVYDYDPALRVRAHVRPPAPGQQLSIVNVLGMSVDEPCAGILDFAVAGTPVSLVTISGDAGYFVMLRDATSDAEETYPAGRYLDVPAADANGETWVDLNRLYTPPCAYTSLATCPLPPAENVLAIPIRAGERWQRR
jgi:uncharacterized protein (DUF1684 family)